MQLINGAILDDGHVRAANRKMRIWPIIQDVIGLYSSFPSEYAALPMTTSGKAAARATFHGTIPANCDIL